MKKLITLALCAALAVVTVGCAAKAKEEPTAETGVESTETETSAAEDAATEDTAAESTAEQEYPQIVYIDNVLYYGTGEECLQVPRKAPEGTIETFCSKEIMPDAPLSANFGEEYKQMEYMHLEDGNLIVHMGEKWFIFNKENS